ncbi:conserved hypothetical protein [Thiomonas arsenitoxydans]|uniref:Uncharacterized protein n=1 Tax=Thiomonas arsenitoxydans (strain DSM 22701 / CIP 110005 / 3As) TaxID=426114 RepID=D6CQ58_THIA3|nr:hypothetical protein [Thiomonas arsenitoxydans]CAZ88138.1 conserved Hypothetical protein [Thiomonas arsenitoxydans]CQR32461.1 conserved hypothetical protein [Thiomonas arsenitoxydans]CQR32804.1 conserved hypothetical protein [Thiomonas arsenitoxydans]CQR34191.1 conserved hypothetical protein [Thiomonas arsenitoxydans]CQR40476.1 conserved hypothetical protein [Thiomonas arsenitoxydans]
MPFEIKVPNATRRKAMAELESGRGKRFASVDNLMKDLHAGDALTVLGRKIGLPNEDFAAFEQDRGRHPAQRGLNNQFAEAIIRLFAISNCFHPLPDIRQIANNTTILALLHAFTDPWRQSTCRCSWNLVRICSD